MPVFNNILAGASGQGDAGYKIEQSLRFDHDAGSHLSRTPTTVGNTKKFTFSVWAKRSSFGNHSHLFQSGNSYFRFQSNDKLIYYWDGSSSVYTTGKLRDPAAWVHCLLVVDTTLSSDRVKIYVNGVQQDTAGTDPGQNADLSIGDTAVHYIGSETASVSVSTFDGYLAEAYYLDGIAVSDASAFGEFHSETGVWVPIEYEGNYNGAAVAGTSFANAGGGLPYLNTTNDGQTVGSGYVSGATSNAVLLIPGTNTSEEPTSNSISNQNSVRTTSNAKWYGTALEFSRSAASQSNSSDVRYFNFNNNLNLQGRTHYTIEAWVYPRSGSNGYNMVFEGDWNNNNGMLFNMNNSGRLEHHIGDGGFQSFYSNLYAPMDAWSHVAVVCDNNAIKFFLNGVMHSAGARSKTYSLGNNHKVIGAYVDSNHGGSPRNGFYGYMQDIRVSHSARYTATFSIPGSGAQNAGANGFAINFSGSNVGADSSPHGNNFTATNFTTALGNGDHIAELSNVTNGGDYTARYRNAFDGNLATESYGYNNDTITWTPSGGKAYTSARVYGRGESGNNNGLKYKLVGGTETTITVTTSGAWYTLPANGTIEYISWNRPGASSVTTFVNAIEINGTILVDNSLNVEYDKFVDTPTNASAVGNNVGNYCTLNPIAKSSNLSLNNGALEATSNTNAHHAVLGTFALKTGKWYFEMQLADGVAAPDIGWHKANYENAQLQAFGGTSRPGSFCISTDGNNNNIRTHNDGTTTTISATSWATGDIIGCAIDMDAKKIWFRKNNGAWYAATTGGTSGDPTTGAYPTISYTYDELLTPRTSCYGSSYTPIMNFGARGSFSYAAPSGYNALCTQNLPKSPVANGSKYVDAKTWTGANTNASITITSYGFSPGLIWAKSRSNAYSHQLYDTVRGAGKSLAADSIGAEQTNDPYGYISAFNSDGFTAIAGSNDNDYFNGTNKTYVAWAFEGGASFTNASGSNGASVASSGTASGASGTSIVSYSGNGSSGTVWHGLNGKTPHVIIAKNRDTNANWFVYHKSLGTNALQLNTTNTSYSPSPAGINAASSTTFTLGGGRGETNTSGENYIAYCFAPVDGYSAMGSFEGQNEHPFIFLGFRPSLVIIKNIDAARPWKIYDDVRDPDNPVRAQLYPNANSAEVDGERMDFMSNGFKLRTIGDEDNGPGNTMIYIAFASNSFQVNGGLAR